MDISAILKVDTQSCIVFLFSAIGLIVIVMHFRLLYKSLQSQNWLKTRGTVIKSEVNQSESGINESNTYNIMIRYEYVVNNSYYTSNRMFFGNKIGFSFNKRRCENFIRKYPEGSEIAVFYNPTKHSESVIEPGVHSEVLLGFIAGAFLCVCSYYLLQHPEIFS